MSALFKEKEQSSALDILHGSKYVDNVVNGDAITEDNVLVWLFAGSEYSLIKGATKFALVPIIVKGVKDIKPVTSIVKQNPKLLKFACETFEGNTKLRDECPH
jgi:hypothetical protein